MYDEHFYTRALKLNPEKAKEYYNGRAEFYCKEYAYDKAYKDFKKAEKLGVDISSNSNYLTCCDFVNIDYKIKEITEDINNHPNSIALYHRRARYYLLKRQYTKCLADLEHAISIDPCPYNYEYMDNMVQTIRESYIFDTVNKAKKKDLIKAYKVRINFAKGKILSQDKNEYWSYRAEKDLDRIVELSKDKALAMFFKFCIHEEFVSLYSYQPNYLAQQKLIYLCQKVIEKSRERTDRLGKALTYIYELKLISLYSNNDNFEQAIEIALLHKEQPPLQDLKKALNYIKNFANVLFIQILRKSWYRY